MERLWARRSTKPTALRVPHITDSMPPPITGGGFLGSDASVAERCRPQEPCGGID
jgi:hypothetical protein